MAKYLFVTWDGGGNLPPQLAVAKRLLARGHEVAVLAEPPARAEVEVAGCRFEGYLEAPVRRTRHEADDPFRDWEKNPVAAAKTVIDRKICGPSAAYARDVLRVLDRSPADVLVVDGYLFGGFVAGEHAGLPTAVLSPDIGVRPIAGRPPGGPGFPPARGLLGRIRDRLVSAVQRRVFSRGLAPLNATRKELGLPPLRELFEAFERVDRHLLMTARAFDYDTQPPANVRYVGPQIDDPVWTGDWSAPWQDPSRPRVLVSLGSTFQGQADLYRRTIAALGELPLDALVTLGGVFNPREFDAPDHVRVVQAAPHPRVLPHVQLMVTHGGHGSVMRSLSAGVPLVCLPIGRDQNENAARIEAHGVGLRRKPGSSIAAIREAITTVLHGEAHRAATRAMAEAIARELEGDPVVAELEQLASRGRTSKVEAAA